VAVLLAAYALGPIEHLDANALTGFVALATPHRLDVAEFCAHLADPDALLLMLAALAAVGVALGRRREVVLAAASVAAANVTTQTLKLLLAHPRIQPVGGPDLGPVAFPSGHATAAMSIAVAAALVAPQRARPFVGAAGVAFTLGVSLAILTLGWHFPSDVLGGMLIATGAGFVALAGLSGWERWRPAADRAPAAPLRRPDARLALEAVGAGVAAAVLILALAWAQDLLDYARLHTAAVVAASTLGLACAMLMASLIATASR
jgi:membrane-associated phospholipid phosphatase